jgi:hypothetical protein
MKFQTIAGFDTRTAQGDSGTTMGLFFFTIVVTMAPSLLALEA